MLQDKRRGNEIEIRYVGMPSIYMSQAVFREVDQGHWQTHRESNVNGQFANNYRPTPTETKAVDIFNRKDHEAEN